MLGWQAGIAETNYRIALAHQYAPTDPFTSAARVIVAVVSGILTTVLIPVQLVTTFTGGCLIALTFGIFAIALTIVWLPILAVLVGTSWLWLKVWPLRPILLLPGALFAVLSTIFIQLTPEPEKDAKYMKGTLSTEWPLTWYILNPPIPAVEAPADDEVGESEEDAWNGDVGEVVLAYTKSGRKPHILIDDTDNLALCGRECERRIRPEGVDPVDLCNTCWYRHVGNRRYWARRLRESIGENIAGEDISE